MSPAPFSPRSRRLSVLMIVRDAAVQVDRTLESIHAIADEIVVVDTGSTDKTVEIADSQGAQVLSMRWTDDFSAARNFALAHATGDWILWLDAGETIALDEVKELKEFVQDAADPAHAYLLMVRVPSSEPHAGPEQIARVRLVPRNLRLRFVGRVRESLVDSLAEAGLTIEGAPWRIDRSARDNNPETRLQKAQRNLQLVQQELKAAGPSSDRLNCAGCALQVLGAWTEAAQCFRQAIALASPGSPEMLEGYYGLLTSLDAIPGGQEAQLATAVDATEKFPLDAQLLCALGGYLQTQGRIELATRSYEVAYRFGKINPWVWHLEDIHEMAANCLAASLVLENRFADAEQLLRDELAKHSQSPRLRGQLLSLFVRQGRRDEALAMVDALPRQTPHREALRVGIRGACLAAQQNWVAASSYLRAAFRDGCQDTLVLRWLATTLLATGQLQEADEVLRQWRKIAPHSGEVQEFLDQIAAAGSESPAGQTPVAISASGAGSKIPAPAAPSPGAADVQFRVDRREMSPAKDVPHVPPATTPLASEWADPRATS